MYAVSAKYMCNGFYSDVSEVCLKFLLSCKLIFTRGLYGLKGCYTLLFFFCAMHQLSAGGVVASIQKGVYDASVLLPQDIATLEGEWVFVPGHFVSPKEDFSKFKRYENISTSWAFYNEAEEDRGYATYALKITGLSPEVTYAIKSSECFSACTAYVDGVEFLKYGRIGKSKEEEEAHLDAIFAILPVLKKRNIVLVFHISNFHNTYSAFSKPIKFGLYSTLDKEKNTDTIRFTLLSGYLMILAAFFISLYIFYVRSRLSVYFGLLCANFALRICCYDEFLINSIFPFVSYDAVFKIGYATFTIPVLLITFFLQRLFRMTRKSVLFFLVFPLVCYLTINIFAPTYISSYLLVMAQVYAVFVSAYDVILVIIKSVKKNRIALFFLFGLLLFFGVAIYDILVANQIIEGKFIAHFGVLAMLIPMSIIVLQSFKISSDRLRNVTSNIEGMNASLSRFLPDEFAKVLGKNHTEIKLGDNALKEMYIAFIHLNICNNIFDEISREKALRSYNLALSYINPIIEYHHGFIDKYMPEGLMVLFEDKVENVLNCMLQIHLVVQQKNMERALRGEEEFVISTGVHYGKVMIGTIGEEKRMDSTVISDVVNVAARLHSYALSEGISIVASQIVKDNFEDDIRDKPISFYYKGRVKLKGKTEEVEVYEVIRE